MGALGNIKFRECGDKDCINPFMQFNSLQKYCSPQCKIKNLEVKPKMVFPLTNKRIRIPYRSKKRKDESAVYSVNRIVFLNKPQNKWCPVYPYSRATEVHHKKGRIGALYLDENFWLAVSERGHKKIELNPIWAKEKGYSLLRLANYGEDTPLGEQSTDQEKRFFKPK